MDVKSQMILGSIVTLAAALVWTPAGADGRLHCAFRLDEREIEGPGGRAELIGCYDTYADAVGAGTHGAITLEQDASPDQLTDVEVDNAMAEMTALTSVLIGTEWDNTGCGGASNSYYASSTCSSSQTWSVSDLGQWNNVFSSGKGYGSCNHNRKFQQPGFDGEVLLCTPNCSNYGTLSNRVSSLRWKD